MMYTLFIPYKAPAIHVYTISCRCCQYGNRWLANEYSKRGKGVAERNKKKGMPRVQEHALFLTMVWRARFRALQPFTERIGSAYIYV
ncbi:MAG: hypothetical protein BA868_09555 [Desulfobacterales bacterium C00003106]|nr:MAG: hypothetical protein BA868_09555 [Desulfobacterales bacterium C00003106]